MKASTTDHAPLKPADAPHTPCSRKCYLAYHPSASSNVYISKVPTRGLKYQYPASTFQTDRPLPPLPGTDAKPSSEAC